MSEQHIHCARCHADLSTLVAAPCPSCGYELSQESRRTLRQLPGRTAALLLSGMLTACAVPAETPDASAGSAEAREASAPPLVPQPPYGAAVPPPLPELPGPQAISGEEGSSVTPEPGSDEPTGAPSRQGPSNTQPAPPTTPSRPAHPVPVQPYGVPIPPPPPVPLEPANEASSTPPGEASGVPVVPPPVLEVPPVEAYGMPPMDRLEVPEVEEEP